MQTKTLLSLYIFFRFADISKLLLLTRTRIIYMHIPHAIVSGDIFISTEEKEGAPRAHVLVLPGQHFLVGNLIIILYGIIELYSYSYYYNI